MTTGSHGSKLLNDWGAYFLTVGIFALDCLLGNVYKVVGSADYVEQVYQYVSFKEIFSLIPYILLVMISLGIRLRFDKFDIAILFTCLILEILNCVDFFVNYNWRPMWSDWLTFGIVFIPATVLKIITNFKK